MAATAGGRPGYGLPVWNVFNWVKLLLLRAGRSIWSPRGDAPARAGDARAPRAGGTAAQSQE